MRARGRQKEGPYKNSGPTKESSLQSEGETPARKCAGDFELMIFRNLKFPLCGNTKQQMLIYAKKNGFEHILKKTISCWFPDSHGNPCGRCNMCKGRIKF